MITHSSDCALALNARHGCTCGAEASASPDTYDKQAAELLPCEWVTDHSSYPCPSNVVQCRMCRRRPAVAAKLREHWEEAEHYRIEASNVYLANEELQEQIAKLKAENKAAYIAGLEAARDDIMQSAEGWVYNRIKALIDAKKGER